VGVLAFILGVVVVVPMYCTASAEVGQVSRTVCSSVVGLSWSGTGLYNPPPEALDLALRIGTAGGIGAAIVTFVSLTLRRHRAPG
jgi:hypothetical protein